MKNIIISVFLLMFLFGIVSSYDISAGDSINITLPEAYDYYSIVGNSTPVNLSVTQEGTIVNITTDRYSPSDSYEIVFFNKEKEVIYQSGNSGGSSGGGGGIVYRDRIINQTNENLPPLNTTRAVDVTNKSMNEITITFIVVGIILGIGLVILLLKKIFSGKKGWFKNKENTQIENIELKGGLDNGKTETNTEEKIE